ncbi:MAG: cell division protein FtsQ/DivIB [Burkholderiales bacterium]|jgi:cell division protein FtsQ
MFATASTPLAASSLPQDIRWMNTLANVFVSVLVLGVLTSGVIWLIQQPYFSLRGIVVDGDVERTSVASIRAHVPPRLTGNFFTMDLQAAQQAFETVPWVRHAALRRVWPNRLEVHLQEHQPAARWSQDSDTPPDKLVNTYGEVFEVNPGDVEDENLPMLMGPKGSSRHMLLMLQRLTTVMQPMQSPISQLVLTSRGSWRLRLNNGVLIELGRGSDDEVQARATRFLATWPEVVKRFDRPLVYADLRHRDAYVVRLKGLSTSTAPGTLPSQPQAH